MRVLIVPASKHGGTAEIGRSLSTTLRGEGLDVDVSQPQDMHDLSHYDGFLIGSAVYLGKWLEEATDFIERNADTIRRKPTWLFSSGPLGEARPKEPVRPDVVEHLLDVSNAKEHRLFSGRIRIDRLGHTERFIARWVGATSGDYREWVQIEQWARKIALELRIPNDESPLTSAAP